MQIIKSMAIKNFQSIKHLSKINLADLSIFVGQNDHGKSNILRALNLFFNGETDLNQPFRFESDYCYKAATGKGNQREVKIELIIQPPQTSFPRVKDVRWVKTWKQGTKLSEIRKYVDKTEIKGRSKVSQWLDKINYRYIPAIRDKTYFKNLMGELHDVLYHVHTEKIKLPGNTFISQIKEITEDITKDLDSKIGIKNTLQVPSNFRDLFSTLDFGVEKEGVTYHLKQRGDGIKNRHIPIILRYMSQAEQERARNGYVKPNTIWGFEDPENNLEMTQAFKLAEELVETAKLIQMLVSTHSPAIYAIHKPKEIEQAKYLVKKENELTEAIEITQSKISDLDECMGITHLISPYVEKAYEEREANLQFISKLKDELTSLEESTKVFVLTEDSKEESKIEKHKFLKNILESNGFNLEETEFFTYNGSGNFNAAIQTGKILRKMFSGVKILIHRDRDYHQEDAIKEWQDQIGKAGNGFTLFVTDGVDIGSQYLRIDHLKNAFSDTSAEDLESLLGKATEQTEDLSIEKFTNFLFEAIHKEKTNNETKKILLVRDGLQQKAKCEYSKDRERYRYSKRVLKLLLGFLQEKRGENPMICVVSDALKVEKLSELRNEIWSSPTPMA